MAGAAAIMAAHAPAIIDLAILPPPSSKPIYGHEFIFAQGKLELIGL
jgi:hypothetical protein